MSMANRTMPEMEKGRPPENKRSRKPAHPVKREINQEMKVRGDKCSSVTVWCDTAVKHRRVYLLTCS